MYTFKFTRKFNMKKEYLRIAEIDPTDLATLPGTLEVTDQGFTTKAKIDKDGEVVRLSIGAEDGPVKMIVTGIDAAFLDALPNVTSSSYTGIFTLGPSKVIGSKAGDFIITYSGAGVRHVINAGDGDDRILTGSGDDLLFGGKGNDRFDVLYGDDIMKGGAGDDAFHFNGYGNYDRTFIGGSGTDTFYLNDDDDAQLKLSAKKFQDLYYGRVKFKSIENLVLGEGDDTASGNKGDNYIDGVRGQDILSGGKGNDTLRVWSPGDFDEWATMKGGPGADTFVIGDSREGHYTQQISILDFKSGRDKLDLSEGVGFDRVIMGSLNDPHGAGDVIVEETANGIVIYADFHTNPVYYNYRPAVAGTIIELQPGAEIALGDILI